ncbi:hypothetical protein [Ralstonia pseudosolanacearum]|uniref:hypothetical protein n=1 Tax=Ralstonia pseudosolanacearum TaxID=1310165 RepID=UPI003CEB60D1
MVKHAGTDPKYIHVIFAFELLDDLVLCDFLHSVPCRLGIVVDVVNPVLKLFNAGRLDEQTLAVVQHP